MRNAKTCPKCRSGDIVRIPGSTSGFGAGNNIAVGKTIFSSVKVTRYMCASCGFSEEWIDDIADVVRIKAKFAS